MEEILENGAEHATGFIKMSQTMKIEDHEIPEVSQELGEAALIISTLRRSRGTQYTFDPKTVFKYGNRAFYLHVSCLLF